MIRSVASGRLLRNVSQIVHDLLAFREVGVDLIGIVRHIVSAELGPCEALREDVVFSWKIIGLAIGGVEGILSFARRGKRQCIVRWLLQVIVARKR